jgi:2,3-bisphosphoglycerate-dependent phosphoglycerate mutase
MRPDVDLLLVRHGESVWNSRNLVQGQSPLAPGLTTAGRKQTLALATKLRNTGAELVLSSDLCRAVETALPIASVLGVPLERDPRLRERAFGALEGLSNDDIDSAETGIESTHVANIDTRPRGGESIRELYSRVAGFFDDLTRFRQVEHPVVIVTHGGVVRVAIAYLSGTAPEDLAWTPVPNGSVVKIPKKSLRKL